MNIRDILPEAEIPKDMLIAIFEKQKQLEEKYEPLERKNGAIIPEGILNVHTYEGQRRIKELMFRIADELFESSNCLRNKDWKTTQVPTDEQHFKEELIDMLHFVIALYIKLGMSAEDIYLLYCRKNEVNQFRIRSNY